MSNLPSAMVPINSTFIGLTKNYLHHGPPKLLNAISEIKSMMIFIIQKEYHANCDAEFTLSKEKLMKADYPLRSIDSVVNECQKSKECGNESFITPPSLFEITKPFIFVEIPYCELNEIKSKHFLKKFNYCSFRMIIVWKTRNVQSLFHLKGKNN